MNRSERQMAIRDILWDEYRLEVGKRDHGELITGDPDYFQSLALRITQVADAPDREELRTVRDIVDKLGADAARYPLLDTILTDVNGKKGGPNLGPTQRWWNACKPV